MFPRFLLLLTLFAVTAAHADWLQFRGPNGSAVSTETKIPADTLKVAWSADLPGRGLAAPIIVGDKVFVTCGSGPDQATLHVICFSAKDGHRLWERVMRATGRTMTQGKTGVAAATPCSDGKHVFALYSSNDLFCFDLDGNLVWLRGLTFDYSNASNSLGMAQSPVVVGDTLIVQSENDSESFAAGIDIATGINRWKIDRPKAANWSSALLWSGHGAEAVALQSSKGISGVDARTGKELWNYADGASTIPSSALGSDAIYASSNGITALLPEAGAVSQLWRNEKLRPGTASPIALGGNLYVVNNAGVLLKADTKTGTEDAKFKLRLKGPFSGSPVGIGSKLYIVSERGIFQAVDTSTAEGKVQEIDLAAPGTKELVMCTPAIANGAVYVRSDGKLWKVD